MSTLTESDIFTVNFQDDVDSFPHRENYANVKNAINDNQTQIDNLLTPPAGSEVTNARDNYATLRANIRARRGFGDRIISVSEFVVAEQGTPDNTVQVSTGSGTIAGIGVNKTSSSNSGVIAPSAAGKHRIVMFAIQSDNTIVGVEGSEIVVASAAVFPSLSSTQMPLAWILIDDTSPVVINNADINDARMFLIDPFRDFEYHDQEYTYNASNDIDTMIVTDLKNNTFTFQFVYDGSDQISTITVTINGVTYVRTYVYVSDNISTAKFTIT